MAHPDWLRRPVVKRDGEFVEVDGARYFITGDTVVRDAEGYLFYQGRADDGSDRDGQPAEYLHNRRLGKRSCRSVIRKLSNTPAQDRDTGQTRNVRKA